MRIAGGGCEHKAECLYRYEEVRDKDKDVCCKGWLSKPLLLQRQVGSLVAD